MWLDKIRPRFVTEDGHINVGSDVSEVFNHMAVQTYQQEQMLRNQKQESLKIVDIRYEFLQMQD